MHAWAKQRTAGQQLTLEQCFIGEYTEVTPASVGLCAPGDALIRHFFLAVSDSESSYKLSWRQQNVGVTVGAIDATMKRGNALPELKIRQTVWSNDLQAPLVGVFVNSASMEDPGFTAACDDYNAVVVRTGMEPMRLVYVDCPHRDGPGAARRLPSLTRPSTAAELDFLADGGSLTLISTVAACDAWVKLFDNDRSVELGADLEWRAPQRKGEKRGQVATLQLVSLRCADADQLTGAIFSLTKLGKVPASLVRLLGRAQLSGVDIKGDVDKLVSDRLRSAADRPTNLTELSILAPDVLRVPASHVSSLEKVLARCCPGRSLNKRLVDVRRFNWEAWPLPLDGQRYAINDAYAGAMAMRRLLHPDRRAPLPRPMPPPAASDAPDDGEAGATLLDGMDGDLHAQLFGDPSATDQEQGAGAELDDAAPEYALVKL